MFNLRSPIIGILGGVGPEAGQLLQRHLHQETLKQKNVSRDSDHLPIIHLSLPECITDRTEFILGHEKISPASGASLIADLLLQNAKILQKKIFVAVPCNTFHSELILPTFQQHLAKQPAEFIEFIPMIQTTCEFLQKTFPPKHKIGILATTGTIRSRLYSDLLEQHGFEVIIPSDAEQRQVHDTIYHPDWGIKSRGPSAQTRSEFEKHAANLIDKGAQVLILGCTEIPLVLTQQKNQGVPMYDPMQLLAKKIVSLCLTEQARR